MIISFTINNQKYRTHSLNVVQELIPSDIAALGGASLGGAPLGAFDSVSRGHLILKPCVSLVKEETEDEVLAAMEETSVTCPKAQNPPLHTSTTNEALRESSMEKDLPESAPRPIRDALFNLSMLQIFIYSVFPEILRMIF